MPEQDRILSQHEVDALLSAIDSGEVELGMEERQLPQATPYDFKRPERVARDQLRAIGTLHEVMARNLQTTLAGMLRTVVDVEVASVDQLTFSEFINSLPNPTVFNVLSCEPLEGHLLMVLNPTIAFPIIERLLGSRLVGGAQPERELTPIEWNLIDRVTTRTLEILKDAWEKVADLDFKVTSKASNPQLMQIMSPNEPVIMVVIEMTMGEHKGYLNLCIPVLSIEPLMEKISTHTWFSTGRRRGEAPSQEQVITRSLNEAEMEVMVHLPPEQVMLSQLLGLSPGDILTTNQLANRPVLLSVEGRPKFTVRLGTSRQRMAACVEGAIAAAEEFKVMQPAASVTVTRGDEVPERAAPETVSKGGGVQNLLRVPVDMSVVLAQKVMNLNEILSLKPGDILDFDKKIEDALDLRAGGRSVARGITVKMGERFGMQISEIRDPRQRLQSLGP